MIDRQIEFIFSEPECLMFVVVAFSIIEEPDLKNRSNVYKRVK